ncbi:MAG: T9SS type A sorting domain-containing protein [Saprospiraceae bacterium]
MKNILLFFILCTISFSVHAQDCTISATPTAGDQCVFSNPGTSTLTVPLGITVDVSVQAWGGGGGPQNTTNSSRGGGGGGGYAKSSLTLTAGTYTIVVGEGGSESDGGDSVFGANVVIAGGGEGTTGNNSGDGGTFTGDEGNNGGDGGARVNNGDGGAGGGAGGNGGVGGNGEDGPNNADGGVAAGGTGGMAGISGPGGGAGGDGGDVDNNPIAGSGNFPGGGGGGKGDAAGNSGKGAGGQVIITVEALALPVELTSFESKVIDNNSILLFWQTASEENNSHFIIEHSRDGERFSEIGKETGKGTTTNTQTYSMSHERLAKGHHYYRLKQVDFDGKFQYSNIISAQLRLTLADISVAPNPVTEKVTIFIDTPISIAASYQLINMQKEVMIEKTIAEGNSSFEIDMSNLPGGVYFMKFYVDQEVIAKKIVKLY